MRIISFLFLMELASAKAFASPMPPAPICHISGKLIKDLGIRSTLHKDLLSKNKKDRPFQCTDIESSEYKHPHAVIKILESKTVKKGGFGECPKIGSEITVILPRSLPAITISESFSATIEYSGDECYSGHFLSEVKTQK